MKIKVEICLLLTLIYVISYSRSADAYCSLERMKKFAIDACEHLFQQDEAREKRSVGYHPNLLSQDEYGSKKKHMISRSIYPPGGYLKVDRKRFHKLSQIDIFPKYKRKIMNLDKHERFKRDHRSPFAERYQNLEYCCFHRCEADFFC